MNYWTDFDVLYIKLKVWVRIIFSATVHNFLYAISVLSRTIRTSWQLCIHFRIFTRIFIFLIANKVIIKYFIWKITSGVFFDTFLGVVTTPKKFQIELFGHKNWVICLIKLSYSIIKLSYFTLRMLIVFKFWKSNQNLCFFY